MVGTAPSMVASGTRAVGRERGNRAQQAVCVGMRGGSEDIGLRAQLDQVSGIHHSHAIGDLRKPRRDRAR